MNTAHVLAWLTCLALAFFACVLSVRNTGTVIANQREVTWLKKQIEGRKAPSAKDMQQIRRSLREIAAELQALRESGDVPEGREQLQKLEERVRNLQGVIENAGTNAGE